MWAAIVEKLEELEQHPEALDVGTDSFDDADDEPLRPDRVHRRGRRVLTSAAPTVTEGDGDRCRCGRGVRGRVDGGVRAGPLDLPVTNFSSGWSSYASSS